MVVLAVQKTADVIVDKVAAIALGSGRLAFIVANGAPATVWTSNTDGTAATEIAVPEHDGLTPEQAIYRPADDLIAWSVVATIYAYSGGPKGLLCVQARCRSPRSYNPSDQIGWPQAGQCPLA